MSFVEALNLPKDVMLGMPVITAIGKKEVHIENFKAIMEYDSECVKIMSKTGPVVVNGKKLIINYYNEEEIHIKGIINNIEL